MLYLKNSIGGDFDVDATFVSTARCRSTALRRSSVDEPSLPDSALGRGDLRSAHPNNARRRPSAQPRPPGEVLVEGLPGADGL